MGVALVTLGALVVLLTGSVPLTSSLSDSMFLTVTPSILLTASSNQCCCHYRSFGSESSLCCPNLNYSHAVPFGQRFLLLCAVQLEWPSSVHIVYRRIDHLGLDRPLVYVICYDQWQNQPEDWGGQEDEWISFQEFGIGFSKEERDGQGHVKGEEIDYIVVLEVTEIYTEKLPLSAV